MRLLVITNYYPPHYKGGYELACRDCCEFLASGGHEIFILTGHYGFEQPQLSTDFKTELPVRSLKYIDYANPSIFKKHRIEKYNYKITRNAIDAVKPDLIYIWNIQGVSIAPVIAAQKSKVRRIFEIGDLWAQTYAAYDFFDRLKFGIKAALPFTIGGKLELSPIISVSDWIGKEMSEKYGSGKVYSVPNGIKEPKKIKQARNNSITKYIFTGRIDPQKGIDTAIKAFIRLTKSNSIGDFCFDIYGSGDDNWQNHCQRLIDENNLAAKIKFCGRVDDIADIYADYDIMLMPTMMREPFGMVTVEAFAAGLPVIATNKYGPAEIITDGVDGLLYAPGEDAALAEKITILHNDNRLYCSLAKAARDKYLKKYRFDVVKSRVEQILLSQIQQKDSPPATEAIIINNSC